MKSMTLFGNVGTENREQKGGGQHYNRLSLLSASLVPLLLALIFFAGDCAQPTPNYTVTFNVDGGSAVESQSIASGGKVTKPSTNPTKTGYTFVDWYNDAEKTTVFDFNTAITASVTLYAKWTQNKFIVTFNVDGGSAVESQSIASGSKATKPTNPTKTGYTFDNWYKDAEKTTVFDFNTAITASVTLYAKWNAIPISSIALDQSTATIIWNENLQLTATFSPADVPDKSLTWTSSNTAIATVSSTGLVTGLSSGTATITATSVVNNTKQATCVITIRSVYKWVPDPNFRADLKGLFPNAITTAKLDSLEISHTDVKDFAGTINVALKSISSLSGIEYFTKLTQLYCYTNQLTSLDVSKNTALTGLWCYSNQLTNLDVSKNTALTELHCSSNQLTSLDVSKNTSLVALECHSNKLTSLDVSKNTSMVRLICNSNQLTSLDVSKNTSLTTLSCHSNKLTSLDVSKNTSLIDLYCNTNQLTSLDVSNNTSLTTLWCVSNQLTSLDVRGMRSVSILFITTLGTGTNNSGLTSIKVHSSVTSTDPASKLNAELIKVKLVATSVQIDSYTSTGTPDVTYTSAICDYDPSTGAKVAGSMKVCK